MNFIHPVLAIPIGTTEMVIIFLLVLIMFGAKKLPTFARSLGKSMGEFRKAKDEFERELTVGEDEVREKRSSAPRLREPIGKQPIEVSTSTEASQPATTSSESSD